MLGDSWAPTLPALRLLRADTEEDRQALIQRGKVPPPAASEEEAHEFTIAGGLGRRDRWDRSLIDPQKSSSTDSTVLPCSCQILCSVLLPNCPGTSSQQERCLHLSRFSLRCALHFVFCARPWVVGESIEMLRLHKAGLGSLVACQDGCPSKSATFSY